jgi:hypothetical protein
MLEPCKSDLIIPNLGAAVDEVVDNYVTFSNYMALIEDDFGHLVHQVCKHISPPSGICTKEKDPKGYYIDYDDCINHFINIYPRYGPLDHLMIEGNTSVCRLLHLPSDKKCIILGKTGCEKCIDNHHEKYYYEEKY